MVSNEFSAWGSGFQKAAFNRLLREEGGMRFTATKRVVDELLAQNCAEVVVESQVVAEAIRDRGLELRIGGVRPGGSAEVSATHTRSLDSFQ